MSGEVSGQPTRQAATQKCRGKLRFTAEAQRRREINSVLVFSSLHLCASAVNLCYLDPDMSEFVSRGGQKLDHALSNFKIDVTGWTCADLGSNVGGFVDCLLQRSAKKVYAIDTGYGVLNWKLRKDP